MKKKILLFACIEKNIGDDIFIKTVCDRYPNCIFIISKTAQYGALKEIKNLKFSKTFYFWQRINERYREKAIKRYLLKPFDILLTILLRKYKYAIYIVGNAFKNNHYKNSNDSYWLKKRVFLVPNFYLISTNFGPFDGFRWKDDCEKIFRQMTDICFRDLYSYNLFKSLPNVRYAPDAVLSLGKNLSSTHNNNKKNILISVIDFLHFTKVEKLGNFADAYENKIIDIIKYFSTKGYNIKLVNFNSIQDREASKRIIKQCELDNISMVDYDGNLSNIYDLYENTSYVIGTRLHSIILAWIYDKPVIPIIYDMKVEEMLKTYQFEGLKLSLETITKITPVEIENNLKKYDFKNKKNIVDEANKQFKFLDRELLKKGCE